MCCLYVWAALSAGVRAAGFGCVGFCVCHFCFVTQSSDKKIPRQWLIPIGGGLWSAYFTHFALVFLKYESEV